MFCFRFSIRLTNVVREGEKDIKRMNDRYKKGVVGGMGKKIDREGAKMERRRWEKGRDMEGREVEKRGEWEAERERVGTGI